MAQGEAEIDLDHDERVRRRWLRSSSWGLFSVSSEDCSLLSSSASSSCFTHRWSPYLFGRGFADGLDPPAWVPSDGIGDFLPQNPVEPAQAAS